MNSKNINEFKCLNIKLDLNYCCGLLAHNSQKNYAIITIFLYT